MADYYIDGSVAGSAGVLNGSGTLGDPWTQNSGVDLLEAARQAILTAGGGAVGTAGDTVIVLDGGLTNTTAITFDSQWNQLHPFVLRPYVMDGTQRIDFDLGGLQLFATDVVQQGHNYYFTDFHGFGSTGNYQINGSSWSGYYFCTFDSNDAASGQTTGILNAPSGGQVLGCRFLNDARTQGLIINTNAGGMIRGNYFELSYASYAVYTYGTQFSNNVLRCSGGHSLGSILPIQGGQFTHNTFYGTDVSTPTNNGGAFYIPDSYEHNVCFNNYFENMRRSMYISSTHQHSLAIYAGNYEYNTADPASYPNSTNTTFMTNNDQNLSRSGLVDPANGDYRPNDLLIGKGFNLENYSLQGVTTGRKTIGAIEVDLMPPRVRDLY